MKTKSLLNTSFLIVLMGITGIISAQDFTVGNLNYSVNDNGVSVTVTGHVDGENATGELNIPEYVTYNGNDYVVTAIADDAFYWCCGLTGNLNIPNSVTYIGGGAFLYCYGFTGNLSISNSVTHIGNYAFYGCQCFTGSLIIPNSVTHIGDEAFGGCVRFTELILPNSVTYIGDGAFDYCYGFTGTLNIPNSVTYIGDGAFVYCYGFTGTLNIPNSLASISNGVFSGCTGFSDLIIPSSVTEINSEAFFECSGLTNISIPNSVTFIGNDAFYYCTNLSSLFIPSSVTEIEGNPFRWCSELAEITVDSNNPVFDSRNNCNAIINTANACLITGCKNTVIPNTITEIGAYACYGCSTLTNIDIPNNITIIGDLAFYKCGLTSIYLPSSINQLGSNPFAFCSSLESISVDPSNLIYDSRNSCNAIINSTTLELVAGCKNTIMPNNITAIGNYAFAAQGLTGILEIPLTVTTINEGAFCGCDNLTGTLNIPNSVTYIGRDAFNSCCGFTGSLIIPNSVNIIGAYAFAFCDNYTGTLVIGNSVTEIGDWAFVNCSGFTEAISLANTPPMLDEYSDAFNGFGCYTLTVPCGCIAAYQNTPWYNTDGWKPFSTIHEDCSSVSEFDDNSVSLYPNPTSGSINIKAEYIQSVSIYSMLGEKMFENAVNGDSFNYDFSGNEKGVYLISIETPEGVATKKVTVR